MQSMLKAADAFPFIIGIRRSVIHAEDEVESSHRAGLVPAHHLEGMRSTMFDGLYIPGGSHIQTLQTNGRAVHWVREAFAPCKALGASGEGVDLLVTAIGSIEQVKLARKGEQGITQSYGVVTAGDRDTAGLMEKVKMAKDAKDFAGAFFHAVSCHRHFDRELDGLTAMVAY
jgi:catalase